MRVFLDPDWCNGRGKSDDSKRQPLLQGRAKLLAADDLIFRDDLWRKNGFGRLRVEVDDHAFSHALEPPACGDPVELSLGILPVRSCGNDGGIRPTLDPPQNRIIDRKSVV